MISVAAYRAARMRLFQDQLKAIITSVSPVAVDAMAAEGLTIEDVVGRFQPPVQWPEASLRLHDTFRPTGVGFPYRPRGRKDTLDSFFERRHRAVVGTVIRPPSDVRAGLGARLCGYCLDVAIMNERFCLTTGGGKGRLHLRTVLPETIIVAMPGRRIGDVVDHPVLTGKEYRIRRVLSNFADQTLLIVFDAESVAYGAS